MTLQQPRWRARRLDRAQVNLSIMDTDCHERSDFNIALRTVTALRIFTRIFVLHDLRVPRITVNHGCPD